MSRTDFLSWRFPLFHCLPAHAICCTQHNALSTNSSYNSVMKIRVRVPTNNTLFGVVHAEHRTCTRMHTSARSQVGVALAAGIPPNHQKAVCKPTIHPGQLHKFAAQSFIEQRDHPIRANFLPVDHVLALPSGLAIDHSRNPLRTRLWGSELLGIGLKGE